MMNNVQPLRCVSTNEGSNKNLGLPVICSKVFEVQEFGLLGSSIRSSVWVTNFTKNTDKFLFMQHGSEFEFGVWAIGHVRTSKVRCSV